MPLHVSFCLICVLFSWVATDVSGYHKIWSRIASEPVEVECPDCGYEVQVWPHETEAECMSCGSECSVARGTGGEVSLEPLPSDEEEWQVPERLYHGTSLKRLKDMLASPRSFELYLADSEDGTEGYANEAAAMDESDPVTVVFDTEKLMSSGQLGPDWDDVNTMIKNGDGLFGDAVSAHDVSWMDSLRIISTCSYEGDVSGAIVEVLVDSETVKPPFEGLRHV